MQGFDIIGDVHGCATELEALLGELGYRIEPGSGAYRHPERQAIFVGDLIDRGPEQLRVLEIAKAMVDHHAALMVMGNHEFNALAYASEDPLAPGTTLRPHNEKNIHQHEAFLGQLDRDQRRHYLAWFLTLPLWLDLGGLRVVHACWHQPSMTVIEQALGANRFTTTVQLAEAARTTDPAGALYRAVEVVLKGPELSLAAYGARPFRDKEGHERQEARIRWWRSGATRLSQLAEVTDRLAGTIEGNDPEVSPADRSFSYNDPVPVLYGHYWRRGQPVEHEDWTAYTACVDFSAVKGGTLVAYRFDGERTVNPEHYHPHGPDLVAPEPS